MMLAKIHRSSVVCVLDDDKEFLELVATTLEDLGFVHVFIFTSAMPLMDFIRENDTDLIFLDVFLPDANGLTLLSWIKKKSPSTRVVMFSGDTSKSIILEAKLLGADSYLSKFDLTRNIRQLFNTWYISFPLTCNDEKSTCK